LENRITKRDLLFISVLVLCLCSLVFSMEQKSDKWKGTDELKDGIRVVKNPVDPIYGEMEMVS